MNAIDYFFEDYKNSEKAFLLNKNEQISYSELFNKTISLSEFLKSEIGENNNIILFSTNSLFFIISYLAIIKSGNICVPINPVSKEQVINFVISETNPKLIFLQKRFIEKFNEFKIEIISDNDFELKTQNKNNKDQKENNITVNFDKERLAEIIYTSGSTAFPKGVMLSHKNLIANTESIIKYLKLTDKDTMLVVLPFYYCYGLSLLHTHLKVGGSIVLNNTFMLIGSVINNLKDYKCTGFAGVPSHFQILLRKSDSFKNTELPDLKYVTQAGGKLHTVFISEFTDNFKNTKFYVMYGQTEATARLSYLPYEDLNKKLGSIGKAIPNVKLQIVDEYGNEVNNGQFGEIVASGDNIMKGYYNDKELTNKTIQNGKLFTGDLAKKDEDGYIYIVARKKEIIKVGGERISPKEIEEVIVSIPEVIDCTIEGVYDEILGEKIKAIIVVSDKNNNDNFKNKILEHCKKNLSSIKIPQELVLEKNVNVNASGKKVKI
ncbi:MAG: AMP-binding protein [Bacteroidales bacterium]|nr:AMP-binding protein [Bacteroidales bacterium]MBN2757330.1 AMP-binding protein [Bacteroidales bacterium]